MQTFAVACIIEKPFFSYDFALITITYRVLKENNHCEAFMHSLCVRMIHYCKREKARSFIREIHFFAFLKVFRQKPINRHYPLLLALFALMHLFSSIVNEVRSETRRWIVESTSVMFSRLKPSVRRVIR